jgi:acetyl esterase/lipase
MPDLFLHAADGPAGGLGDERVARNGCVYAVSVPRLVPYLPPAGTGNGTAILVCPGGGYHLLDWSNHVERLAQRLNPLGFAVIGLRYRLAPPSSRVPGDASDDLRQALLRLCGQARRWRLDPARVVGLGFSAGANLLLRHVCDPAPVPGAPALRAAALLCLWPHDLTLADCQLRQPLPEVFLCATETDAVAPIDFTRGIADLLWAQGADPTLIVHAQGDHLAFNLLAEGPAIDWVPDFVVWLGRLGLDGRRRPAPP